MRHVQRVDASNPSQPTQPTDLVIFITNYCNTTQALNAKERNLWEGTYTVDPPDTIASQFSSAFKYGFRIKADDAQRVNGTVLYTDPMVFLDFFSVPHEWGVSVQYSSAAKVTIHSADVGGLAVYDVVTGLNQVC